VCSRQQLCRVTASDLACSELIPFGTAVSIGQTAAHQRKAKSLRRATGGMVIAQSSAGKRDQLFYAYSRRTIIVAKRIEMQLRELSVRREFPRCLASGARRTCGRIRD
jgi:hypothetical protein